MNLLGMAGDVQGIPAQMKWKRVVTRGPAVRDQATKTPQVSVRNSEEEMPLIFAVIKLLYFIPSIFQKRAKTVSLSCEGNS